MVRSGRRTTSSTPWEAHGHVNGGYFDESRPASPNPEALVPEVQSRLMAEIARLT